MKITIQNIEHIPWAKRLIITWYIELAPSDPEHGNWEYLLPFCGYKNVCDEEWTVMEPNNQHPQHTDVIIAPGTNIFVWDYGGVKGLSPKDFDSTHSYVVQIAAIDSGCNWIDPCVDDLGEYIYETINGEVPIGQPGTDGDENNLLNNCGEGWELLEDEFGCLYCNKFGTTPGGGDDTTVPPDGGIVIPQNGSELWIPGGGWGGPWIGRVRKPTEKRPPGNPPIFPNPPRLPYDLPTDQPPGGGIGGPIVVGGDPGGDDGGGDDGDVVDRPPTTVDVAGMYDQEVTDIFIKDDGVSIDGITDAGGDTNFGSEWIGSTHGGREADWNNIVEPVDGHNANFPASTRRYTAEKGLDIPSSQAGLNISPKNIPSQSSNSTINNVPGRNDSSSNPSRIVNAVTSRDGLISINGNNNISAADSINPTKDGVKSTRSIRPKGIDSTFIESQPRSRNAKDARELTLRGSQDYKGDAGSSVGSGRRRETAGYPRTRGAGEVTRIKNTPEFESQYEIKLIASPIGVNRVFADCRLNILPRASKQLRLRVYFSQDKIDHLIGETPLKTSSDPRIVSTTAPLGAVRGGEAAAVYAVVDDGGKIIGRKAVSIIMPDAGSRSSSGSKLTVDSSKQGSDVSNLIRPSDSIQLYTNDTISVLLNCYVDKSYVDASYKVEAGAYIVSESGSDASIEIYNAADISYIAGTTTAVFSTLPLVSDIPRGIKLNSNKYSDAVYRNMDKPNSFIIGEDNDIAVFAIRGSNIGADNLTINVGPGVFIKEALIPSPPTSINIDGTIDITFTDLPMLNTIFSVYEAGGNNVTSDSATTYEFRSDLSGGGVINMPVTQLPTYIGLAMDDSGSLYRRTLKWFRIG